MPDSKTYVVYNVTVKV